MAISEIVNISITETQAGTSLAAFNLAAVVAAAVDTTPASYASAVALRFNLDTEGLESAADDWGSSSEAYKALAKMSSQEQKPTAGYIIKRQAAVAAIKTITFSAAIATGQTIAITANGTAISVAFITDAAATYALVETALEAVEGIATAAVVGDVITVTATAEWNLDLAAAATGSGAPTATVAVSTPGRTISDDITDALAEDDTNLWYGITLADTSKGAILAAAATIETTEKLLFYRSSEVASYTASGTTNIAYKLNALGYRRTVGFWHHDLTEFIDAAAISLYLGNAPGSIQLANKSLTGVTATPTATLNATGISVLEGRKINTYRKFGALPMIRRGVRADGNVVEATRDLDYVRNGLRVAFLLYLSQTKKPSLDEPGLAQIQSIGESEARRYVAENILRGDVACVFFVPAYSDISSSDLSAQTVTGCYLLGSLKKGVLTIQINLQIEI